MTKQDVENHWGLGKQPTNSGISTLQMFTGGTFIWRVQKHRELLYFETSDLTLKKVEICVLSGQNFSFARNLIL